MDYLHGDVVDGEREACCDYEYARESHVLRAAALGLAKLPGELARLGWRADQALSEQKAEADSGDGIKGEQAQSPRSEPGPWDVERNRGDVFAPWTAEDEAALLRKDRVLSFEEICQQIDEDFLCEGLFRQSPWLEFFTCTQFPGIPWNSLSACDRREILETLPRGWMPTAAMRVLPMSDGMILQSSCNDLRGHDAINRPMRGKEERKSSRHLKVRAP
jgi:hypothetical protein